MIHSLVLYFTLVEPALLAHNYFTKTSRIRTYSLHNEAGYEFIFDETVRYEDQAEMTGIIIL